MQTGSAAFQDDAFTVAGSSTLVTQIQSETQSVISKEARGPLSSLVSSLQPSSLATTVQFRYAGRNRSVEHFSYRRSPHPQPLHGPEVAHAEGVQWSVAPSCMPRRDSSAFLVFWKDSVLCTLQRGRDVETRIWMQDTYRTLVC